MTADFQGETRISAIGWVVWDRFFASIIASNDAIIDAMRTTLTLDDELLGKAEEYTGLSEKTALVREAMKALIERESARRLAQMGGIAPNLETPPRRRPNKG